MSGVANSGEATSGRRREVLQVLRAAPGPMSIVAIAEILDVREYGSFSFGQTGRRRHRRAYRA